MNSHTSTEFRGEHCPLIIKTKTNCSIANDYEINLIRKRCLVTL